MKESFFSSSLSSFINNISTAFVLQNPFVQLRSFTGKRNLKNENNIFSLFLGFKVIFKKLIY